MSEEAMHPYRPLFVNDERRERRSNELRGLAVLLVVLGTLRIVPAMMGDEPAGSEIALAATMLVLGVGVLVRVPLLWSRIRRAMRFSAIGALEVQLRRPA